MIIAANFGVYECPADIEAIKDNEIPILHSYFDNHKVVFVLPDNIKQRVGAVKDKALLNPLYEAYKIGMLKLFLEYIYPDKKNPEYFKIIRERFQVFSTNRKMQLRLTLFKKEKELFFSHINVPDQN